MGIQAQVEGIGTLNFPDGTDPSVVQATVKKMIASKGKPPGDAPPAAPTPPVNPAATPGPAAAQPPNQGSTFGEHADIAASLGSASVASLAGGIVRAGGYGMQALGLADEDAGKAADRLEQLLTWQPKTDKGKAVMADVAHGLKSFEDWTDKQGEQATQAIAAAGTKAGEVAKSMGAPDSVVSFIERHKDQVAAAYGSATKTGLNAVPLLAGKALELPAGARVAGDEGAAIAPKPPTAPPPAPAPAAAPLELAPSQPRTPSAAPGPSPAVSASPPLEATSVPRGTPNTTLEGAPPPPAPTPVPQTPTARAQAYVRDRLGLSWDDLGARTRAKLELVAQKADGLDNLSPEAVKRQAHLERDGFGRKPITTTAGKLERDNAALLSEQGAAATKAGQSIVDTDIAANRDLRTNIETLVSRLRGVGESRSKATSREQVGEAVVGRDTEAPGALIKRERASEQNYQRKFNAAEKTDPTAEGDATPLFKFLQENPSVQHTGWMGDWLKKAKVSIPEGAEVANRGLKLNELWDLRKRAVKEAGNPANAAAAGDVIASVDKIMEEGSPTGAAAWKDAINDFKAHKKEFANTGAIERLVGTKGGRYGTDPKTALEDVWKTGFKNAKVEEVRQLKRSLIRGDTPEMRLQGKQALRTLRAETGQDLLREITKGVSTNSKGETNITAESINKWIQGMGGGTVEGGVEKLEVLIGKRATNELMRIREDAQITKTEPTVRNVGSNTFQKILNWMEDSGLGGILHKVGGGPLAHLGDAAVKSVQNASAVRAAGESATSAGERVGAKIAGKRQDEIQREQTRGRPLPPTYGDRT